ncbi:MAG TPA: AraC family transcriptional regulator [Cyclobacteriaceae bacterium]|nr:AraC family transcriptional regulator [Cyclobacteriaceae bacterium]
MSQVGAIHRYSTIPEHIYKRIRQHPLCSNFFLIEIGYEERTLFYPVSKIRASDEFILVYVVFGVGWYRYKKHKHKVGENDFFVLPVKSIGAIEVSAENPWTIYWAFFAGTQAAKVSRFLMGKDYAPKNAKPLVGRVAQFNDILHHLDLMENIENLVYVNSRFYSFVCSFKLRVLAARKHGKKDRAIHTIEYMRENIGKVITLEELANVAGLSVSHYCAVFKKRTSQTPMQLFTSMKIQRACQWLQNQNQTIKSVAYNLGFFDQYHFSKVFKEVMGVTPKVFKKGKGSD